MKFIVFFLIIGMTGHAFGQVMSTSINETQTKLKKKDPNKKRSKFSSTLDMTMTTDTKAVEDEKSVSSTIWYFLKYRMSNEYALRLWINTTKDLAESYEATLNDTRVTLSKKSFQLAKKLKLRPSVSLVIPTSEKSKRNEQMIAGVELNASLAYKISDKWSASYLPRVVKNFHEYETSRTNTVNTEYKVIQFIGTSYSFNSKWSFNPLLIYVNSWSYKGTRRDPSYLSILEVGYNHSNNISMAVGTSTGGSVLDRKYGPDENIKIYDKNVASFYGNLVLKF